MSPVPPGCAYASGESPAIPLIVIGQCAVARRVAAP
jgi:hypothetical protein